MIKQQHKHNYPDLNPIRAGLGALDPVDIVRITHLEAAD